MKGIVLAGGRARRLHPTSLVVPKAFHPVYNKPMISYPMQTLYDAGIRDMLVITNPEDYHDCQIMVEHLDFFAKIQFAIQEHPLGIPDAFRVARRFYKGHKTALILGDNIFCGGFGLEKHIKSFTKGATIFGYKAPHPERYGVVGMEGGRVTSLEEKPTAPKSDMMIPGLYLYDEKVFDYAEELVPSKRGEFEITDLSRKYMDQDELRCVVLPPYVQWFDCGNHDDLLSASNYVRTLNSFRDTS